MCMEKGPYCSIITTVFNVIANGVATVLWMWASVVLNFDVQICFSL